MENLNLSKTETISLKNTSNIVERRPEVFVSSDANRETMGKLEYFTDKNIGVFTTSPEEGTTEPKSNEYLVVPLSYEALFGTDATSDLESKRLQVIANMTGKTVVGVETPGFGMGDKSSSKAKLLGASLHSAAFGGMKKQAQWQVDAIKEAASKNNETLKLDSKDAKVSFFGYSMGNMATTDMLKPFSTAFPDAEVDTLYMLEGVSDQDFSLLGKDGLLQSIGRETNEENVKRYLKDNQEDGLTVSYDRDPKTLEFDNERKEELDKAKKAGMLGNLALGLAMRKGYSDKLTETLKDEKYRDTEIRMFRTDGSEVAREEANAKTANQLKDVTNITRYTIESADDEPEHHHPIWQSLPAVAVLLEMIGQIEKNELPTS